MPSLSAPARVRDNRAAPDTTPLVRLENIGVRFGRKVALERVSLSIKPGEIVTIIGPNGAGKSTLVRTILGLVRPFTGTVATRPGATIGYVPQRLVADPVLPLTVSRLMSLTRRVDRRSIEASLEEVGAGPLIDRQVQTLSGGEMQRVLLARALLRAPSLLVLDEPTQNVDFQGQAELYELIRRIRDERGCGIVLVSHDLHVVMAATDRVLCLNRHVCCAGTPESVSEHPEYRALFGPRAAASMAVYRHAHAHRHTLDGEVVPLNPGAAPSDRRARGHEHQDGHDHGGTPGHAHGCGCSPAKEGR